MGLFGRSEDSKTKHEVELEKALADKKAGIVRTQPGGMTNIDMGHEMEGGVLKGGAAIGKGLAGNATKVLPTSGGEAAGATMRCLSVCVCARARGAARGMLRTRYERQIHLYPLFPTSGDVNEVIKLIDDPGSDEGLKSFMPRSVVLCGALGSWLGRRWYAHCQPPSALPLLSGRLGSWTRLRPP